MEIGSRKRAADDPLLPRVGRGVLAKLAARAVIDGEIVVADAVRNRLDFEALQQRFHPAASRVRLLAERTPRCVRPLRCRDVKLIGCIG